jgi:hypothetical protein
MTDAQAFKMAVVCGTIGVWALVALAVFVFSPRKWHQVDREHGDVLAYPVATLWPLAALIGLVMLAGRGAVAVRNWWWAWKERRAIAKAWRETPFPAPTAAQRAAVAYRPRPVGGEVHIGRVPLQYVERNLAEHEVRRTAKAYAGTSARFAELEAANRAVLADPAATYRAILFREGAIPAGAKLVSTDWRVDSRPGVCGPETRVVHTSHWRLPEQRPQDEPMNPNGQHVLAVLDSRLLHESDRPAEGTYPNLGWQTFPGWLVGWLEYQGLKRTADVRVTLELHTLKLVFEQVQ